MGEELDLLKGGMEVHLDAFIDILVHWASTDGVANYYAFGFLHNHFHQCCHEFHGPWRCGN